MDEEYFFPQNVRTSYRLLGMGPVHLRRAAIGAPVILATAITAGAMGLPLPVVALGATILAGAYGMGYCAPVYSDDQALWDLWAKLQAHQRKQTVYHYQPPHPQEAIPDDVKAALARIEAATGRAQNGAGVARPR